MKYIGSLLLVLIVTVSIPFSLDAKSTKMSRRDKEYKQKHLKKFGRKTGYQGNKDWTNFSRMAIDYEDQDVLMGMLKVQPTNRVELTEYITDLFNIHRAKPEFFIKTSYKFYKKNMDCVVRLFKTDPQLLTLEELEKTHQVKVPSATFKKYLAEYKRTDFQKEKGKVSTKNYVKCQKIKESYLIKEKVKSKSKK